MGDHGFYSLRKEPLSSWSKTAAHRSMSQSFRYINTHTQTWEWTLNINILRSGYLAVLRRGTCRSVGLDFSKSIISTWFPLPTSLFSGPFRFCQQLLDIISCFVKEVWFKWRFLILNVLEIYLLPYSYISYSSNVSKCLPLVLWMCRISRLLFMENMSGYYLLSVRRMWNFVSGLILF